MINKEPQDKLLSIREFLEFIGYPEASEQGVRSQMRQGCLESTKMNGRLFIKQSEAERWLSCHKVNWVNKRLDIAHMYHQITLKHTHRSETVQPSLLKKEGPPLSVAEKSARNWNESFNNHRRLEAKVDKLQNAVDKLLAEWKGKSA